MTTDQSKWLTLAPMLFLMLWSGGYVAAKYGLQFAEPMTFLVIRYSIVVVIMAVAYVVLRPPLPKAPADWLHVAMVGFLIQSVYFGMCYLAFKTGMAVGTIALILALQPIVVGLVTPSWTGERIGLRRWGGLILGLAGAAVVIVSRSSVDIPSTAGIAFGILALFGITAGSLWEKRFGLAHHPVTTNLIGYIAGLAGILPLMLLLETMHVQLTPGLVLSMTYLVIGNSVIAVTLLLAMIRAGDVGRVSALFFLVPPLAALLAWIILDEIMPPVAWLGVAIASVGVYIATRQEVSPEVD